MARLPYLDYVEIVNNATVGGYASTVALSQNTSSLLLSACRVLANRYIWQNPINPITDQQYQDIINLISAAESELMISSSIGAIFASITAQSNANYLLLAGGSVPTNAYPELASIVPTSWVSGGFINLPDMDNAGLFGGDSLNVGDFVGDNEHLLTVDEMPQHTHSQNPHSHSYNTVTASPTAGGEIPTTASIVSPTVGDTATTTATNNATGGSTPHNNIQRSLVVYWYIVAR